MFTVTALDVVSIQTRLPVSLLSVFQGVSTSEAAKLRGDDSNLVGHRPVRAGEGKTTHPGVLHVEACAPVEQLFQFVQVAPA